MVEWVVLRQYLYPALFSLISIYLFLKYKHVHNKFITVVILVLLEFSFLGKEQFMTLPFILFVLANGTIKEKAAASYPFFFLVLLHFFFQNIHIARTWRLYRGSIWCKDLFIYRPEIISFYIKNRLRTLIVLFVFDCSPADFQH